MAAGACGQGAAAPGRAHDGMAGQPKTEGGDILASIVIPAHNAAAFLGEAVASAQAQTARAIEILVVDDASTDATWEIAGVLAAADPRIRPLRRPRQGGVSAARNAGLAQARGRWIALLDADDLFLPRRIEALVAEAEARGADLLADNLLERDFATGADLGPHFPAEAMAVPGPLTLGEMLRRDMPDLPGTARLGYLQPILRNGFLRASGVRFAEGVAAGEDFLLMFESVARGGRFLLTPEAHYVYRRRGGSASAGAATAPHYSAANRRLMRVAAGLGDPALMATLRRRQALLDYSAFVHALERRRFGTALRHAHADQGLGHVLSQLRAAKRALLAPPR